MPREGEEAGAEGSWNDSAGGVETGSGEAGARGISFCGTVGRAEDTGAVGETAGMDVEEGVSDEARGDTEGVEGTNGRAWRGEDGSERESGISCGGAEGLREGEVRGSETGAMDGDAMGEAGAEAVRGVSTGGRGMNSVGMAAEDGGVSSGTAVGGGGISRRSGARRSAMSSRMLGGVARAEARRSLADLAVESSCAGAETRSGETGRGVGCAIGGWTSGEGVEGRGKEGERGIAGWDAEEMSGVVAGEASGGASGEKVGTTGEARGISCVGLKLPRVGMGVEEAGDWGVVLGEVEKVGVEDGDSCVGAEGGRGADGRGEATEDCPSGDRVEGREKEGAGGVSRCVAMEVLEGAGAIGEMGGMTGEAGVVSVEI